MAPWTGRRASKPCGDTRLPGRVGKLERDLVKVIQTEVKSAAVILQLTVRTVRTVKKR